MRTSLVGCMSLERLGFLRYWFGLFLALVVAFFLFVCDVFLFGGRGIAKISDALPMDIWRRPFGVVWHENLAGFYDLS